MVWFVCKMFSHMCTFASENLTVKGIKSVIIACQRRLTVLSVHFIINSYTIISKR